MLLPGDVVEVRSADEILATLGPDQALEGLPFMPEMLPFCGKRFEVALRAQRTCAHPPGEPFRKLERCVVLAGLRCDGAAHGGCQLGCMFLWKEAWLKEPAPAAGPPQPARLPELPVKRGAAWFCQATELPKATRPGESIFRPLQYIEFLRARTFTPLELVQLVLRMGARRAGRLLRKLLRRNPPARPPAASPVELQPGDWVQVKTRDEILATLDVRGAHRGLAFSGEMYAQCGRTLQVSQRVERIIVESTGELRQVRGTVILAGAVCDRYLACARGMPLLWREAWLRRTTAPAASRRLPVIRPQSAAACPNAMA